MWSASLPAICPGLSMHECGAVGFATRHTAFPVLCHSESGPLGLSVHKCRASGSASGQTACPIRPTLCQSRSHHGHASPLHPGCLSLPLLPVWMSVFYFLGVGLPCCSIFCQFWLFFVFKLLLSFFWLCEEAVCLPTPPSWPEVGLQFDN